MAPLRRTASRLSHTEHTLASEGSGTAVWAFDYDRNACLTKWGPGLTDHYLIVV